MSEKLRVGFVWSTEVGLRTYYLNWRHCLPVEANIDMSWIITDWWREDGLVERLPLLPDGLKTRIRARLDVRAGMRGRQFDLLYVGAYAAFYANEGPLTRQPYVLDMDATPELVQSFGDLYGEWNRVTFSERIRRRLRQRVYDGAAAFVAWSNWAADGIVSEYGVDPQRVRVIPPGIDLSAWDVLPRDAREGDAHILFVGGDLRRKGGDLLLHWADTTRRTGWRLHLVTRDPVATANPNVRVYNDLGPNDPALRALYEQADIFALPTRADCYSLASIEAMAASLPVILSEVGGTGDIVRDGETGYLIPPADGPALTQRLEALLDDASARLRMGRAARLDAEARYDAATNILKATRVMRACV